MSSKWHEKKAKLAAEQFERELQSLGNNSDNVKDQTTAVAMGGGEEQFYEKKLSKEEKKALAAKKREEKRKAKAKAAGVEEGEEEEQEDVVQKALENAMNKDTEGMEVNEAAEQLAAEGTICTFSASRKGVDARSRDVNVQNFTLQHKGAVMLDGTSVVLNHGNRYGLIGRNGEKLIV
jgi:ATPase subunit of ABC transporter with duplicated ATPase domains